MQTDPDLVKARETARNILRSIERPLDGDFIPALEAITAALLRAQADGIDLYDETGMRSEQAQRLRALADREEHQ